MSGSSATSGFDLGAILTASGRAEFASGIATTLEIAFFAWILGMSLAVLLLGLRLAGKAWLDRLVQLFLSYHRNVPVLVQIMFWYFGIPTLFPQSVQDWLANINSGALLTVVALTLYISSYFCEDLRAGLRALPTGQTEAARALGLGYLRTMRHVLLPQSVRGALPSLINNTVILFKSTSLAMAIGVAELTYVTQDIQSTTYRTFESYTVATVLYLAGSLSIMGAGALLARHFRKVLGR